MICIDSLCDKCKNEDNNSKPHAKCKAYPEGIPYEWYSYKSADEKKLRDVVCNNGIGYKPIKE